MSNVPFYAIWVIFHKRPIKTISAYFDYLVTLLSKRVLTLSPSDFWARATVMGIDLSVTKFLRLPLVTLESNRVETLSASDFYARVIYKI